MHGIKDATTDDAQIRDWWTKWPTANIAVAVPPGFVVLDVDDETALPALLDHGIDVAGTASTTSSPGRGHYWFSTDVEIANVVRILRGLDIRSHGALIVVPPSRHATGSVYAFSTTETIAAAPPELATLVNSRHSVSGRAAAPLGSVLDGVPEGSRDTWIFRQACRLVVKNLHEGEQRHLILTAAAECSPPFPERRALQKLERAQRFARTSYRLTDVGNAERFVDMHGEDVRYCRALGWLIWDGRRWTPDESSEVMRRARETARMIYAQAENEPDPNLAKKTFAWARSSESVTRLKAMIEVAQSNAAVVVRPERLDSDPMLLNVRNGTLDLRDGHLRRHQRGDLMTKLADVEYDATATADLWLKFLDKVMDGNPALISFLQRAAGYSLTADIGEHVLFLLYGTGANGKSTFLETFRSLLGDYAMQAEFSTFTSARSGGGGPRNDLARLKSARFVSAVEMEAGSHLAESVVKQMTGGDTVSARYLYKEFFEFKPQFKLFLASNHRPNVRQTDDGIWRRILFVPFTVTIPPAERDKKLTAKLVEELPGILNWALAGVAAWRTGGLAAPQEVLEATADYRQDNDPLADFIEAKCVLGPENTVSFSLLYSTYHEYCESSHETPMNKKQFGESLTERGLTAFKGTNGRRCRRGIAIAPPDELFR